MASADALLDTTARINELVPFNRFLGLNVIAFDGRRVTVRFAMRPEFIGNPVRGALHGGIIGAVLDSVGGFAAFATILGAEEGDGIEDGPLGGRWLNTIDMRTDFLRPGTGNTFEATGYVLRSGRRVVVSRMELCNETGEVIAVGTGTYAIPDNGGADNVREDASA